MSLFEEDPRISDDTKDLLKKAGYKPRPKKLEHKHYKKDAVVNMDYNLLENFYVVRKFVQKKFNISLRELELLLYLFPKGFFSHQDYKSYPLSYSHRLISTVIKLGWVRIFTKGENQSQHTYTLTKSAKHIVIVFYKYLSGELKIPLNSENNPLIRKDASSHQQKIIKMFKIMRKYQKDQD